MCGIAGLFNASPLFSGADERDRVLRAMAGSMRHRGPDDEGIWHDPAGRCSLAQRRLAIIDLSPAGHQPMLSRDGRWALTYNGEIYNFASLRDEFASPAEPYRGRSDTEVLLRALARRGADVLPRLDGMYAFAAFDRAAGRLLLARDPFGEKPLYYVEFAGGGLAFASELQALEGLPGVDLDVCPDAVAELLMFQYVGAPRTIYRGVRKLPPGHWLVAEAGRAPVVGRHFAFRPGESGFDPRPLPVLAEELESLLSESLRRRLISDVPLGAFLSGGVDSSTVCALIRGRLGVPLKTYSIGFADAPESEHETARAFARHLGTEHHEQVLSPDASSFLLDIGRVLDEPNADSSCLPTYLLSRFARESVTVAISGDGGDELFGGYGRYHSTIDAARRAPAGWDAGAAYYSDRILVSTEAHVEELFGFIPAGAAAHLARLREEVAAGDTDLLCRLRRTDVDNYMPGAVLPKVDRMSMQHSLEVRTPFLSIELARFAERLPPQLLYDGRRGKRLLREVAYRHLPRTLVDLPKQGFGLPMSSWARSALLEVAARTLEGDDSRVASMLGRAGVARFLARQRSDGGFAAYQLWALAMLESWLRHHPARLPSLDEARRAAPPPRRAAPAAPREGEVWVWPLTADLKFITAPMAVAIDDADVRSGRALTLYPELDDLLEACGIAGTAGGADFSRGSRPIAGAPGAVRWSDLVDAATGLGGQTWLLQSARLLQSLDPERLERLRRAGLRRLASPHPHAADGTVFVLGLQTPVDRARLRSAAQRLPRAQAAGGHLHIAGPIAGVPNESRELSHEVMLFAGRHQLPPLPASHDDIRGAGGGRYSIWGGHAFFSPLPRRRAWVQWPLRALRRQPATDALLQYVPSLHQPARSVDRARFTAAIGQFIAQPSPPAAAPAGRAMVVFTHALPPGGAERQWCYLALELKARGEDVHFVTAYPLEGDDAHYLPLLEAAGIEMIRLDRLPAGETLAHVHRAPVQALLAHRGNPFGLRLTQLAAVLSRLRPCALFAQLDESNLTAATAGVLCSVPRVVLSFRNYNPSNFSYLVTDWQQALYRTLADAPAVVLSGNARAANDDYADWIGIGRERVALVPNAIDTRQLAVTDAATRRPLRAELGIEAGAPVLIGVFRLNEEKRPLLFVDVCARVLAAVPAARVLLVGVGPMEAAVRERIDAAGLSARIGLLGRRHDVPALMAASDLLLLVSAFEGTPNVVLEAQAVGIPVVAPRVGGVPDCVRDGDTGHVLAPDDEAGFVDRCVELLTDAPRRQAMGARAAAYMRSAFSRSAMADRYLALAGVAGRGRPGAAGTPP